LPGVYALKKDYFFKHILIKAVMVLTGIVTPSAWAADGYVYDSVGNVTIGPGGSPSHAALKNDTISSGTVITTGDKSNAVLKFDDGEVVAMQANSSIRIKEYRYTRKNAGKSRVIFSDLRGGLRFVNKSIVDHNPVSSQLDTVNATIDIHNTDFMVATLNDTLYSKIIAGSISMSNKAGTIIFTDGQVALAASSSTLPISIPDTALPQGVFSRVEEIPLVNGIAAGSALNAGTGIAATNPVGATAKTALPSPPGKTTGRHHVVMDSKYFLCDFCTGPTHDAAHIAPTQDAGSGSPVTGDAHLFGKHNLTTTGANTGEICAFCHTPQGSESQVASPPLWNRTAPPLSNYRAYSTMGSATDEASGSLSMSCLSCHDGTQAPNIVINTPSNKLNVPFGEQIYTGNLLKNHHPVGMPYGGGGQDQNAPDIPPDPVAAYDQLVSFNKFTSLDGNKFLYSKRRGFFKRNDRAAFNDIGDFSKAGNFDSSKGGFNKSTYSGSGNGTVWWVEPPNSKNGRQKTDFYLFTRTDKTDSLPSESVINQPYVECATCHDPHSGNPTFLRLPGGNARSQICLTCHNK